MPWSIFAESAFKPFIPPSICDRFWFSSALELPFAASEVPFCGAAALVGFGETGVLADVGAGEVPAGVPDWLPVHHHTPPITRMIITAASIHFAEFDMVIGWSLKFCRPFWYHIIIRGNKGNVSAYH